MKERSVHSFSTTLEKSLSILELFSRGNSNLSQAEIYRSLDMSKTAVFRLVNTLVELDYLVKDPRTKQLRLGRRAIATSFGFLQNFDLYELIKPLIDEAHERYRLSMDAALLHEDSLMIIYRRMSEETFTFRMPAMSHNLHCTALGKAAMAFLPKEEQTRLVRRLSLVRRTAKTIDNAADLLADLDITFKRGYSINNEEAFPGLISVGAPLIDPHTKRSVGAISFDFLTFAHSLEEIETQYAKVAMDLAAEASKTIPFMN